jgi:hemerythrin superfamily protein
MADVPGSNDAAAPLDAVDQLIADHKLVKSQFDEFEGLKSSGASAEEKAALVGKICDELRVHEAVENEVFFPNVRNVLRKESLTLEVETEQEDATDAISHLGELKSSDPDFDEQVSKLGQQIAAHAAEEESDVFPSVKASNVDTAALGKEMRDRKAELSQT